jgi:hypothetical protein
MKGYGGYLYPLSQKLTAGRRISGYSRYMSGYSGHRGPETPVPEKLQMSNSYPKTPGYCPDTPDHNVRIFRTLYRVSVFNRLPTEGYTQGGKFWVRRLRDQELEGSRNTRLRQVRAAWSVTPYVLYSLYCLWCRMI